MQISLHFPLEFLFVCCCSSSPSLSGLISVVGCSVIFFNQRNVLLLSLVTKIFAVQKSA